MTSAENRFYRQAVREGNLSALELFFADFTVKDKEHQASLVISGVTDAPDLRMLKQLLALGVPLDFVEEEKRNTLLHFAACSESPEICRYLIQQGLEVDARNAIGATPLMFGSCYTGNPKVLQALLEAGADINAKDDDNASVLCIASRYSESEDVVGFLARQGLDLEERDNSGLTPLLSAFRYNSSLPVALALRDAGADLYAKTPKGETALHLAAFNPECSRSMIDFLRGRFRVSDMSQDGVTPLNIAMVLSGNPAVVEGLIQAQREELVYDAIQNRRPGMARLLRAQGIDLNMQTADFLYPILWLARCNSNPAVMEEFLDEGALVTARDLWGRTVFHYAAINEDSSIYEWFKEQEEYKFLDTEDEYKHDAEYYRQHPDEF